MNATIVPSTYRTVKRPPMSGMRKQLYDAAVRICTYRYTCIDHHHNAASYSGNDLIVTHYANGNQVTIELDNGYTRALVFDARPDGATTYRPGSWEALVLDMGRNAQRGVIR